MDRELLEAFRAIIREEIKATEERLLDPEELAGRLKVPLSWVYEQSRRGKIPTIRIGKYVRFKLNEVLKTRGVIKMVPSIKKHRGKLVVDWEDDKGRRHRERVKDKMIGE